MKIGRVTQTVWKYHRFSENVIKATYGAKNLKKDEFDEINSNPIEALSTLF